MKLNPSAAVGGSLLGSWDPEFQIKRLTEDTTEITATFKDGYAEKQFLELSNKDLYRLHRMITWFFDYDAKSNESSCSVPKKAL